MCIVLRTLKQVLSLNRKIEMVVLEEASMCAAGLLAVLLVILFPVLSRDVMLIIVGDHWQEKIREIRLNALPGLFDLVE